MPMVNLLRKGSENVSHSQIASKRIKHLGIKLGNETFKTSND